MAAPHPARAAGGHELAHRHRLRIVDDDHVPLIGIGEGVGVHLVVAIEDRLLMVGDALLVALQGVVDRLCDLVELFPAVDDAPFGVEPGVDHERDQRVLDLGDAAPEGRGGEVQDALALERLGQPADLLGQGLSDQRVVVRKRLVTDVDLLHARKPSNISVSAPHRPPEAGARSSCGRHRRRRRSRRPCAGRAPPRWPGRGRCPTSCPGARARSARTDAVANRGRSRARRPTRSG